MAVCSDLTLFSVNCPLTLKPSRRALTIPRICRAQSRHCSWFSTSSVNVRAGSCGRKKTKVWKRTTTKRKQVKLTNEGNVGVKLTSATANIITLASSKQASFLLDCTCLSAARECGRTSYGGVWGTGSSRETPGKGEITQTWALELSSPKSCGKRPCRQVKSQLLCCRCVVGPVLRIRSVR